MINFYKDTVTGEVYDKECADFLVAKGILNESNLITISKSLVDGYSLEEFRTAKLAEMRKECGDDIDAGFDSSALGYLSQYKNTRDRQKEMSDAIVTSGGEIWRNESYTYHTLEQAQTIELVSISELRRCKLKYNNKCVYINDAARTSEEINAVTWDSVE